MRVRDEPFNPTIIINNANRKALHEGENILKRWEEYFKKLLNPMGALDRQSQFTPSHPDHVEPTILESEVRRAVTTSPKGKAAGDDGITTKAILACGENGIKWLTTIFQKAWEERRVPEDWQNAIVVPIWKNKGGKKDCRTYREISLLSHVGKMYAKILEQRARGKAENLTSDSLFCFRKEKGCKDAIFALRQISEKTIEYNRDRSLSCIHRPRESIWYSEQRQVVAGLRAVQHQRETAG